MDIPYLLLHFFKDTRFKFVDLGVILAFANHNWEGNVRELKNVIENASIALEVICDAGHIPMSHAFFSSFSQIIALREMTPNMAIPRYNHIRQCTNFDDCILDKYPFIKKVDMEFNVPLYDIKHPFEIIPFNVVQVIRENELHLELNDDFPLRAEEILWNYLCLINDKTTDNLRELLSNPKPNEISRNEYGEIVKLGIKLKDQYLKGKEETIDIFNLPWKQAKKEFEKIYFQEMKKRNPHFRTDKKFYEKMGISKEAYKRWKSKFSANADTKTEIEGKGN